MDQGILVRGGHILVQGLDSAGLRPHAAMWVYNAETDTWKLWIVPPESIKDERDFYRRVAEIVAKNRAALGEIDAGDTEMVAPTHPAIEGMRRILKMPGLGDAHFSNNRFNGFYLPDGIVLRMDL